MGSYLSVAQGSHQPPQFIVLRYRGRGGKGFDLGLVGKGITFDSGGISIKPADGMHHMKADMTGAASVIAAMGAIGKLKPKVNVIAVAPCTENLPGGGATKPGDVFTSMSGKTVEVINTDAEGRLVLADAIAYADAELSPDEIVDIATLTGAARIALGGSWAALYSTCDQLAAALVAAGEASGDRLWRMPLPNDYVTMLASPVADLANVSTGEDGAGSIVAALFLREFAGDRAWAPLDIAGAARSGSDDGEVTPGATGFGTRLLLRWLSARPLDGSEQATAYGQ